MQLQRSCPLGFNKHCMDTVMYVRFKVNIQSYPHWGQVNRGIVGCCGLYESVEELITKQELPFTAQNLIITTPWTLCSYFNPKIHKPNNPGRPIVSACSCPTELISSYLDKVMTPRVKSLPSYIKDSNHALEIFRNFNFSGENKINFTMDVTSLYNVIPNNEGLQALKYHFNQCPIKKSSSETLLRLAELVRTQLFFVGDNY